MIGLDGPLAGPDPERSQLAADRIRRVHADGISVVPSTHDPEFAADVADRVCAMADGNIVGSGNAPGGVLRTRTVGGGEPPPTECSSGSSRCRVGGNGTVTEADPVSLLTEINDLETAQVPSPDSGR